MWKVLAIALLLCPLARTQTGQTYTIAPSGDEDPGSKRARQIVDRAINALGGPAFVQAPGYFYSGRASGFSKGELNALSDIMVWIKDDKQRVERAKIPGWITIFNGDKGWDITYHGIDTLDPKVLAQHDRLMKYSLRNIFTRWVKDPKTIYFFDGERYADARQCFSVTLINGQNESVTLLLEQQTYLPLKEQWSDRDPEYHDKFSESVIYDKFRNVQGIQTPFIITRYRESDMTGQTFINEAKYLTISDQIFSPESKSPAPH